MSQQYTDQQREEALDLLRINRNNVALTSHQTGVPERTLREWRRHQRLQKALPPYPPSAAAANDSRVSGILRQGGTSGTNDDVLQQFAEPAEAFQYVYERFLAELVQIADSLPDILSTAPPYHQLLTLMQMIDRIEKLHTLIPMTARQQTFRVEFVDPDGSVHTDPYWQRSGSGDEFTR